MAKAAPRRFAMCGRFKRKSDKQKVARVFEVQAGLEDTDFAPGDDLRPQSMQPVVYTNEAGECQIEMMRWGFKLPDRLLFNARSEGSPMQTFGRMRFSPGALSHPAMQSLNGRRCRQGRRSPNTRSPYRDRSLSAWLQSGSFGRTRRQISGNEPSLS